MKKIMKKIKKITKEDVKNWAKKHKKELILTGGAAATVGVTALALFNRSEASLPFKHKIIHMIQRSIVRDNGRAYTIDYAAADAFITDIDKFKTIFNEMTNQLDALVR